MLKALAVRSVMFGVIALVASPHGAHAGESAPQSGPIEIEVVQQLYVGWTVYWLGSFSMEGVVQDAGPSVMYPVLIEGRSIYRLVLSGDAGTIVIDLDNFTFEDDVLVADFHVETADGDYAGLEAGGTGAAITTQSSGGRGSTGWGGYSTPVATTTWWLTGGAELP